MTSPLIVFYREGCHLCDAFIDELREIQARQHFEFDCVDVDSTPTLAGRYGLRVPILVQGDDVICEFFLDPERLLAYV